jgi:predicted dehydrogenase
LATLQAPVRWGVAGLGNIVVNQIAPVLASTRTSRLVTCVGSSPEKGRAFAEKFAVDHVCTSFDELLALPDVDAVFIATPNAMHHAMVLAAARAGKHILCEKPLALSVDHAREMLTACRTAGVTLRVAYQMRFEEIMVRVREIVRSGTLGDLRTFQLERTGPVGKKAPWRLEGAQGGALFDMSVHLYDLAEWVTGLRFKEVSGWSQPDRASGAPDETVALLGRMGERCHAMIRASRELPFAENNLVIEGTLGSLVTSPLRFVDEYWLRVRTAAGTTEEKFAPSPMYRRQMELFDAELLGEPCRLATGEDGLRNVEITCALIESIATRRTIAC